LQDIRQVIKLLFYQTWLRSPDVKGGNKTALLTGEVGNLTDRCQILMTSELFGKYVGDFRVKYDLLEKIMMRGNTKQKKLLHWFCQQMNVLVRS
jgi:hypothetical protein